MERQAAEDAAGISSGLIGDVIGCGRYRELELNIECA